MKKALLKLIPWILLAVFVVEIVAILLPKREGAFHLQAFGRLPALLLPDLIAAGGLSALASKKPPKTRCARS